jgi:sugar (pentulose or hexulose) kinase
MLFWLPALLLAFVLGAFSFRAILVGQKKRIVAARRVVERPHSFYASKGVRDQEDEEWWRRIDLDRLHEVNREYIERLLRQIDGAGVDTLTRDEWAFMERMANLEAPARRGARPEPNPWPSPA